MSKEERKYEIAEKETMGIFDPHELDITGLSNAIDIYAKEVAIEFAKWLSHNCYDQSAAEVFYSWKIEKNEWLISQDGMCVKTTEQLYELFLKSKQ